MYKVLIVDDEPIICEGLRKSVKWDHYNCEVAGTASNGLEGLEQMKALHPDILITDISMNNMDGLAMVAAIRSEFPDAEVCLLTGYRNFEYAQRAIQLGVTRFLLKPSKMEEIDEAIKAIESNRERLKYHKIDMNSDVAKVSIVGAGMMTNPGVAAKMFEALYNEGININMISTSEIRVTVLISEKEAERAANAIHDAFGLAD